MASGPDEHGALVAEILGRLLDRVPPGSSVTLDAIGDAVGTSPLNYEEIGELLDRLQAAGRHIEQHRRDLKSDLGRVLTAARDLRATLGRPPRLAELATKTSLDETVVLTALRFAQTLR